MRALICKWFGHSWRWTLWEPARVFEDPGQHWFRDQTCKICGERNRSWYRGKVKPLDIVYTDRSTR